MEEIGRAVSFLIVWASALAPMNDATMNAAAPHKVQYLTLLIAVLLLPNQIRAAPFLGQNIDVVVRPARSRLDCADLETTRSTSLRTHAHTPAQLEAAAAGRFRLRLRIPTRGTDRLS